MIRTDWRWMEGHSQKDDFGHADRNHHGPKLKRNESSAVLHPSSRFVYPAGTYLFTSEHIPNATPSPGLSLWLAIHFWPKTDPISLSKKSDTRISRFGSISPPHFLKKSLQSLRNTMNEGRRGGRKGNTYLIDMQITSWAWANTLHGERIGYGCPESEHFHSTYIFQP